ncbi:unnamed protein product [Rotaria sp. Silwood1]|nr:unnamed protein product [Rotaria sp. Silwood1]CAF3322684.1 unnamed protein product [Rotaria sp. Silwood1]CAF3346912.1 unnamed protein product [Rotaria sp. Silwood1]CAF4544700.1 unnamed protein product [Rotaria sp. Silwood1]CAF4589088.1 unnamed protein product [Rotaria sp. Silwood1]
MEEIMHVENDLKANNVSSFLFISYPSTLIMQCKQLLTLVLNRTSFSNNQQLTPPYIRQLLARQNLTLRFPKTMSECILELSRLMNSTNEFDISNKKAHQNYGIQERSRSLIVFVFLIAFVSLISILGNLCLAKVIYSKRFRLSQTDRIVLCLALSELCLVLIDSPTEIYRFLSYSFSQTWLCRFHTFFESLFSSCIIFYHLLGALDRFVYIHGHILSDKSSLSSKWYRRISTKSGSIILLILPILCSLPIAICNLLQAHVLRTSSTMKICIVQHTHGILISFLIFFYILPLLFSFFLHAKLIYFIHAKHQRRYSRQKKSSNRLLMKHNNTSASQMIVQKKGSGQHQNVFNNNRQALQLNIINTKTLNRNIAMSNNDAIINAVDAINISTAAGQRTGKHNSSSSSASSRSTTRTGFTSPVSPASHYANSTRANANAKRTVFLLVLLLSFYVLCWAPYNIYTWHHAYQLTTKTQNQTLSNRTLRFDFNQTIVSSTYNLHADLRRFIFINYSLYLLSMISMCFSFIFYFSLNKQARHEFSRMIACSCPRIFVNHYKTQRQQYPRQEYIGARCLQYHAKYENNYQQNNQRVLCPQNNHEQVQSMKVQLYLTLTPPSPILEQNNEKHKFFATVI